MAEEQVQRDDRNGKARNFQGVVSDAFKPLADFLQLVGESLDNPFLNECPEATGEIGKALWVYAMQRVEDDVPGSHGILTKAAEGNDTKTKEVHPDSGKAAAGGMADYIIEAVTMLEVLERALEDICSEMGHTPQAPESEARMARFIGNYLDKALGCGSEVAEGVAA